ncbi:MAG: hypothetical protein U0X91_08485 [Spirosomataceae bacterium]
MKNISNYIITAAVALTVLACTETNQVIKASQKPVVEAYLAPGQPVSLQLSTVLAYSTTQADSVSYPIDGQSVRIKVSDGRIFNLKNTGNGEYVSAANEKIQRGLSYTLDFTYNGLPITSTTIIPAAPQNFKIDRTDIALTQIILGNGGPGFGGPGGFQQDDNTPLVLTWDNPTGEYYFVVQQSAETNPEQVIVNNNANAQNRPARRINNQPTNSNVANIQPRSFSYFGNYNIILFRLNPDYAALYRSGGTTTQNLSTPPTAITNGLGIFTGVSPDTIRVTVQKK